MDKFIERAEAEAEKLDIDAIEARANKATPGPWCADELPKHGWFIGGYDVQEGAFINSIVPNGLTESDAEFIADARDDVPALILEVRRLRAQFGYTERSKELEIDDERMQFLIAAAIDIQRVSSGPDFVGRGTREEQITRLRDRMEGVPGGCHAAARGVVSALKIAKEVFEGGTSAEPKCVTQTNPDGRGDGDCEDEDCRARMPHDRFHRYDT